MLMNNMNYYLYHKVPKNLVDTTLYPLNELRKVHPEVYEDLINKYKNREELLRQKVYPLGCLWNDVLHFSPVDPREIRKLWNENGLHLEPMRFYQVDASVLKEENTAVYIHKNLGLETSVEEFTTFDIKDLKKYCEVPKATKNHYRESKLQNKKPLMFFGIPHILYKGTIDVTELSIIEI